MDRPTMLWFSASVLTLFCAAGASAAPETMEQRVKMLEERCERGSATGFVVPSTGGYDGGESVSGSLDRNMRASREAMRSPRRDADQRAATERDCAEAARLRAELALWEDRPATTHEAIWEAVVTPVSINRSSFPSVRALDPEERLDRLFDDMRIAKRDRAAVAAYMTAVMDAFLNPTGQSALCERADELQTGADVHAAMTEQAARVTAEKERLLAGLWDAVSLDAAAKISAYALEKVPKTSHPSAEYYADWTPQQITNLVYQLCNSPPPQP